MHAHAAVTSNRLAATAKSCTCHHQQLLPYECRGDSTHALEPSLAQYSTNSRSISAGWAYRGCVCAVRRKGAGMTCSGIGGKGDLLVQQQNAECATVWLPTVAGTFPSVTGPHKGGRRGREEERKGGREEERRGGTEEGGREEGRKAGGQAGIKQASN